MKHWIQFQVEPTIVEPRLKFKLRLKFFKFGLLFAWQLSFSEKRLHTHLTQALLPPSTLNLNLRQIGLEVHELWLGKQTNCKLNSQPMLKPNLNQTLNQTLHQTFNQSLNQTLNQTPKQTFNLTLNQTLN